MIVLITLLLIALASYIIGAMNGALIIIDFIIGMMMGALYSYSDYEEGREHTLQICIFFISITIQWVETSNG